MTNVTVTFDYERPTPKASPNWARVVAYCEEYMKNLEAGERTKDFTAYLREEVLTSLYGDDVFCFINERTGWYGELE